MHALVTMLTVEMPNIVAADARRGHLVKPLLRYKSRKAAKAQREKLMAT